MLRRRACKKTNWRYDVALRYTVLHSFCPVSERGRMIRIENISSRDRDLPTGRRGFIKGMLGAGAFVLSVRLMPEELFGATASATASEAMTKAAMQPNVYLAMDTDGPADIIAYR